MKLNTETDKVNRILQLEQEKIQVRKRIDHENLTTYANNDWNSASESPMKRIEIEIAAWTYDADEVEHIHHGVKINGKYIISFNHKWSNMFKKWYPYKDINVLLAGLLA